MTQKEERLLFTDICARTPYNVIVRNIKLNFDGYIMSPSNYQPICVLTTDLSGGEDQGFSPIEDIRPYLRPMNSMTEEEKIERLRLIKEVKKYFWIDKLLDFYLSHHLDYRGLIPMGLALEAPNNMYKTE